MFSGGAFFFGLDGFPIAQHLSRVAGGGIAENVRVTAHHLGVNFIDHVVNVEFAALLGDACKERDLKKQIAQFLAQIVRPSEARFFQCIKCFVSFFEEHRRERGVGLFAIPGTSTGRAQAVHQGDQISKGFGHAPSFKFDG